VTAAESRHRYETTTQQIDTVRARAQGTVVDSYIGGVGSGADQWLAASNATEASQRRQLLDVIRGRFADDLEQLRVLRQDQARAKQQADDAVAEAARQQETLSAALAELDAQREAQARLEEGLRSKIGDYQARADQLQAAEDELTAVINQHLAEEAAAQARAAGEVATASVPMPKLTASSAGGFIMPTDGEVSSSFGYRRHPILGTVRLHAGTDFGAGYGSPIWAAKDGEVIFAGWNGGYGNCVIIAHEGGLSTLYGHQSDIAVSVGQEVSQGEIIGYVGSTGQSTGPHLHFEVRVGGQPEDPMLFL
jgi:murein DD-endopeptidase MepM/ murein hydrolase activator NlpD